MVGGDVTPTGDVLLFDDNGTHSAMTTAELIARSGARLEIVTPERMLGIDVGGMNHVPYARAFNETDTRITLNQRVLAVRPRGGPAVRRDRQRPQPAPRRPPRRLGRRRPRHGGHTPTCTSSSSRVSIEPRRGRLRRAASTAGRRRWSRNPDGAFQLFRIGDAVSGRNIHAAVYDALRLVKDL